jgi:peptide/nickel transport system permease protein
VTFVLVNLVVDVIYPLIDPRIQRSTTQRAALVPA